MRWAFVVGLLCICAGGAFADIEGRVDVRDGDTIRVAGQTIRLHGIDAPELDQTCRMADQTAFRCGQWVTDQLDAAFGNRRVRCREVDTDRYGRVVGTCFVGDTDIGQWMVQEGLAFAYRRYSMAYDLDEKTAFATNQGLHAYEVQPPADYRAAKRAPQVTAAAPQGCAIKGNISSSGRIYHVPGQKFYANTTIRTDKGERWFCSEAEAQAAGWRRARQ